MRRGPRRSLALVLLLLAVAAAGCGVQSDDAPRPLASDDVPYGLLDQAPVPVPSTTAVPAVRRVNVAVYFLAGDRLQPVVRSVSDPATPQRAVFALLEGPTEQEAVSGLRTAINPTTEAIVTRPAPELVGVDLSAAFAAVPTQEQRLALAQLVFTVTEVAGVTGVRFTLAGAPVEVPLPDGTVTQEPVGRDVFAALAPLPPPSETPQPT